MATLVRFEPFRELASLQSEVSRMMSGLLDGESRTTSAWVPALDVWETDSELVYAFDLPGVPEEAIRIEVAGDTLTVSAERARPEEKASDRCYRFERRFGSFSRAVGLPQGSTRRGSTPSPGTACSRSTFRSPRRSAATDSDRVGPRRPRGGRHLRAVRLRAGRRPGGARRRPARS